MKKFKKIYIEITNICNLNCYFCSNDNRLKEYITVDKFESILNKIDKYTDYIYLHVKGEPLLHPNLKELLDIAYKYKKYVNITTNGTLIDKNIELLNHPSIRQINISLHSENNMENYFETVFKSVENLKNKIIVYRYWLLNEEKNEISTNIVDKIIEFYNLSTETVNKIKTEKHIKLRDNLYLDKQNEFIWPSLDNDYFNEFGTCYALKDQLAILVDGTVIPCCLDSNGVIKLGNIYENTLEEVINSERYQKMKKGFENRKVSEDLCKHCSFKNELRINS